MNTNQWNVQRLDLFEVEVEKFFISYNRAIQPKTVKAKASLWNDALYYLDTDKIGEFFQFIRDSEDGLPSDGKIKKILRANSERFRVQTKTKQLPSSNTEEYPDDEWLAQYHAGVKLVLMGKMTSEAVKKDLGI